MTTETLKPFISAPHCGDNSSSMRSNATKHCKHRSNNSAIIFSVLAVILTLVLLGFTIWQCLRISHLETDVRRLDNVILSMQRRLGITNLDDVGDDGKEYSHAFIDESTIPVDHDDLDDDDDEEDDDDVDDDFDYEEFRKQYTRNFDYGMEDKVEDEIENEDDIIDGIDADDGGEDKDVVDKEEKEEEDMDISDDGDLYKDFSKFNATRKKKTNTRKTRSIATDGAVEDLKINHKSEVGINSSSNKDQSESNSQQRRMLMLRLPSQREELSESKIEQKSVAKELTARKRSHKRNMDSRRYKNVIVKSGDSPFISAKSARQTQPTTNTPAAHFHLNRKIPDHYASIKVDSYSGDMYIGHPSWTNEIDVDNYFKVENGVLTVYEPGLYYVYAQVCYNNTHDQNGFVIFHGHRAFLQCLNTVPTNMPHKIHTCHTSGLIYLKENETIHLRDFHSDRNAILKDANNRSYFGLIKI